MTPRQKASRRVRLWEQEGPYCQICGKRFSSLRDGDLTLDHIVPKFQGGGNNIENLRLACFKCNYGRHH
jgi:5-methylcytosine-specific restriction endonuclease McrA